MHVSSTSELRRVIAELGIFRRRFKRYFEDPRPQTWERLASNNFELLHQLRIYPCKELARLLSDNEHGVFRNLSANNLRTRAH